MIYSDRFIVAGLVATMTLGVGCFTTDAHAQSGAGLMLRPWSDGKVVDAEVDARIYGSTGVDEEMDLIEDLDYWTLESAGRARLGTDRSAPRLGYDLYHMSFSGGELFGESVLPDSLTDVSFGFGMGIAKLGDWEIAVTGGVGSASDEPFGDGGHIYGIGNLIAINPINDNQSWQIILNYDGNRTFLPDVPLPAIAFNHKVNDQLWYSAGIPYTDVTWKPFRPLTLQFRYVVPININATATVGIFPDLDVFVSYTSELRAFHSEHINEARSASDRVFFEQQRVEGGVSWRPCDGCELRAGGGYAFDQEFSTGWDARDLDTYLELDPGPFFRFGLDFEF